MPIKIVFTGAPQSGKTTLCTFLLTHQFKADLPKTVVFQFNYFEQVGSTTMHIWDLSGDAKYTYLTDSFYENTKILIYVLDLSEPIPFSKLEHFNETALRYSPSAVRLLVGTKMELATPDAIKAFKKLRKDFDFKRDFLVSCKTGEGRFPILQELYFISHALSDNVRQCMRKKLDKLLNALIKKSSKLENEGYIKAAQAAESLYYRLDFLIKAYLNGAMKKTRFQENCKQALKDASLALSQHRGIKGFFSILSHCVADATLGLSHVAQKETIGSLSFFNSRTKSMELLSSIEKELQEMLRQI